MASVQSNDPAATVNVIIIETKNARDLDVGVTAVVWEYIITNNCFRTSRHCQFAPTVAVLTTDRSADVLQKSCQHLQLPPAGIIDGYSQWYPVKLPNVPRNPYAVVHIASSTCLKNAEQSGSVKTDGLAAISNALSNALNRHPESKLGERIAVIDSLTSVLRYHPGLSSFLMLCNAISESVKVPPDTPLTLICTVCTDEMGERLTSSLINFANLHVQVNQTECGLSLLRDRLYMHVRRRKNSGRVGFETINGRLENRNGVLRLCDASSITQECAQSTGKGSAASTEEMSLELAQRGLTFRISLSSKEREMRAAAGLPYLHQNEALANSALELHPSSLQISHESVGHDSDEEDEDYDVAEDDEGELFSEDV